MNKLHGIPVILLSLALVACEEPVGPETAHVGTYNLTRVNGQNLPVTVWSGADQATVNGGTLTLNADTPYARTTAAQGATAVVGPQGGYYRRLGNTLILDGVSAGVILADGAVRWTSGTDAHLNHR